MTAIKFSGKKRKEITLKKLPVADTLDSVDLGRDFQMMYPVWDTGYCRCHVCKVKKDRYDIYHSKFTIPKFSVQLQCPLSALFYNVDLAFLFLTSVVGNVQESTCHYPRWKATCLVESHHLPYSLLGQDQVLAYKNKKKKCQNRLSYTPT